MSEVLEILAQTVPDRAVRARVCAYLASPAGERVLVEIELEIQRRVGAMVSQVAAEMAAELEKAKADLASMSTIALEQAREINAHLRTKVGASGYEQVLASIDPAERGTYRKSIEAVLAQLQRRFSAGSEPAGR